MGALVPMGRAFGIIAICMYGPDLPSEKNRHGDRKAIWLSAAKYCMTDETIESILQREKKEPQLLHVYMLGLLNTALVCVRTELPNAARSYAQSHVFAAVCRDEETQRHLGLALNQSVMEL